MTKRKVLLSVFLTLFSLMFVLAPGAQGARRADSDYNEPATATLSYGKKLVYGYNYLAFILKYSDKDLKGGVLTEVVSSKPEVANVQYLSHDPAVYDITDTDKKVTCAYIFPNAEGKTVLTATVTKPDGGTFTLKTTLTLRKWVNPIKKLKVGKDSFTADIFSYLTQPRKSQKEKLSLKLNSGWKLVSAKLWADPYGKTSKTIKNNKNIKYYSGSPNYILLTMKNTKTKAIQIFILER